MMYHNYKKDYLILLMWKNKHLIYFILIKKKQMKIVHTEFN